MNIQEATLSLSTEMQQLRGVVVDESKIENAVIPFVCEEDEVARFIAHLGLFLLSEYDKKVYAQIIITQQPKHYILNIEVLKPVNVTKAIMSLASSIDAAGCDAPEMYKWYKK